MKTTPLRTFARWRPTAHVAGAALAIGLLGACSRSPSDPPPPAPTEVIVEQPGPDYVWVGGYWTVNWWGHYVWVSGRWARPPYAHAAWIAPRWEFRGGHRVFVEGRWR